MNRAVVEKVANALLNSRGGRNGMPPIENALDLVPEVYRAQAIEDAEAALLACGYDVLQATVDAMHHDPEACGVCNRKKDAASPKPAAAPKGDRVPGNSAEGSPPPDNARDASGGLR